MFKIYSKPNCPQCVQAKNLLKSKNLYFLETTLYMGQEKIEGTEYYDLDELKKLVPNVQSVPQIFKDGVHIGGYRELLKHLA